MFTITLSNGWKVRQINVNNVFLYGNLIEDVFLCEPPNFESYTSNLVCKLRKALYGWKVREIGFCCDIICSLNSKLM